MADGVELGKGTIKIKVRKAALRVITTGKTPELENSQKDGKNAVGAPQYSVWAGKDKDDVNAIPVPAEQFQSQSASKDAVQTNVPVTVSQTVGKNHRNENIRLAE